MIPDELVDVLRSASSVAVLTGAGVSAESGIPTFRDALTGLWANYDPSELATPEAFAADPARVTRWYDERRLMILGCEPNAGHLALVHMEEAMLNRGGEFTLITQNIDRLHQRAGSQHVIELHGSIVEWFSIVTGKGRLFPDRVLLKEYPPHDSDGSVLRPGVVWFGESLPAGAMERAEAACHHCDLFMSIGTSAEVYPAAGLIAELVYKSDGQTKTVEINPAETRFSGCFTWSFQCKAGEFLPELVERAFGGE